MTGQAFYWTEVNRGRYLCSCHGGYCCEDDDFALDCPRCKIAAANPNVPNAAEQLSAVSNLSVNNNVSRLLVQHNGSQGRGNSFVKGIAAVGALLLPIVLKDMNGGDSSPGMFLMVIGAIVVALMAYFMHFITTRDFLNRLKIVDKSPTRIGDFKPWLLGMDLPDKMSYDEWQKELLAWVRRYERQRVVADTVMLGGVVFVVIGAEIWVLCS